MHKKCTNLLCMSFCTRHLYTELLNPLLNSLMLLNSLKTAGELEYERSNFATVKVFLTFPKLTIGTWLQSFCKLIDQSTDINILKAFSLQSTEVPSGPFGSC